jgi:hypothetical protein
MDEIEIKDGKITITKDNNQEVYTLKEYADMIYYKRLYKRIYQGLVMIGVLFIPAILIYLFK